MQKMVRKIRNIIIGWFNLMIGKEHRVYQARYRICKHCRYRRRIFGLFLICSKCGCFIKAKVKSDDERCPEYNW